MGIRTIIVDDEPLARDRLRSMLKAHHDIQIVEEASNGIEAISKIRCLKPALVFLDIEMPGLNGFKVVQALDHDFLPNIIFVTAYNQYAINAFEIGAIDYLLKPVKEIRLKDAVQRARAMAQRSGPAHLNAHNVQKRLLPEKDIRIGKLEVAGACLAAHEVGGDYYDYIKLSGELLGICIADISGKGFAAALMMANLQAALRIMAVELKDPAAVVAAVNKLFYENSVTEMYATLFYGVYDAAQEKITFCNAGHHPPLLFQDGTIRKLDEGGTVVGMFADSKYCQAAIGLNPGSVVLGYSDGLIELTNEMGEEFGEDRVIRMIKDQRHLSAAAIKDILLKSASNFVSTGVQHDDLTVMILKIAE